MRNRTRLHKDVKHPIGIEDQVDKREGIVADELTEAQRLAEGLWPLIECVAELSGCTQQQQLDVLGKVWMVMHCRTAHVGDARLEQLEFLGDIRASAWG